MKQKKKVLISIFVCFICLCIANIDVNAYNTFNKHKLKYGVGNYGKSTQYYWIHSNANGLTSKINTAMSEWVNTTSSMKVTTPISYKKTSTKKSARLEFQKTKTKPNFYGKAYFYDGNGKYVDHTKKNWVWGLAKMTGHWDRLSANKQKAVIAHEVGHIMGLAHTNKKNVLMRPDIAENKEKIYRAQKDELNGINYLYK